MPAIKIEDTKKLLLKKSNDDTTIRVVNGKLSFLSLKILNTLAAHSQRMGLAGKGLPAHVKDKIKDEENETSSEEFWWVPMAEIAKDASYSSNDVKILKKSFEDLRTIRVISDADTYRDRNMIDEVAIFNTSGSLHSKGGHVFIGWRYSKFVEAKVLRPDTYTRWSLHYQAVLTTAPALALYAICKRYEKSPGARTKSEHWHSWYEKLTGAPIGDKKPVYKYANRDVFGPAVEQVSEKTDLMVTIEIDKEKKYGKVVTEFYFKVTPKVQAAMGLTDGPIVDTNLFDSLVDIGLTKNVVEKLMTDHSTMHLREVLLSLRERVKNKNLPPVRSLAALFRSYLSGNFDEAGGGAKSQIPVLAPIKEHQKTEDDQPSEMSIARTFAYNTFSSLPVMERGDLLAEWEGSILGNLLVHQAYKKRGLESGLPKSAFLDWYITRSSSVE
jgi:hypothetical protein